MPTTELSTAKYFNDPDQSPAQPGLTEGQEPAAQNQPFSAGILAAANSYLTLIVAAGVILCVTILAVPFLKSAWSERPKNAIDMFLRLGGAKPDQTFEKLLTDKLKFSQYDWDAMYKNSPAYQFKDVKFDVKQLNWPAGTFQSSTPPRRK